MSNQYLTFNNIGYEADNYKYRS